MPKNKKKDRLVHMNTKSMESSTVLTSKTDNNRRFRQLIDCGGWTQAEALALFNKDQLRPITLSAIKSWLSDPETIRFRPMASNLLAHAEKVLAKPTSNK